MIGIVMIDSTVDSTIPSLMVSALSPLPVAMIRGIFPAGTASNRSDVYMVSSS